MIYASSEHASPCLLLRSEKSEPAITSGALKNVAQTGAMTVFGTARSNGCPSVRGQRMIHRVRRIEKSIARSRSFVSEPSAWGKSVLVGDSAQ